MSFSGTPLGQGRRLDHHTFLNKPIPNNRPPNSPPPTSYTYGAPTLGSRSPPKHNHSTENDEPALVRYARLKEREQTSVPSAGSRTITSPLHPEKWSVKDTSVNIASAFHQAAADDMQSSNPNNSWASGSRPNPNVPRSTSVEYEKETQSTSSRRFAAPPNRQTVHRPPTSRGAKPLSKSVSIRHVPDSEGEEETEAVENGRGKSPFEQVVDMTKRVLAPATFYLRQRSQEPEEPTVNGSYDYSAEEREFQAAQKLRRAPPHAGHKRGRMSMDNKAYRPTTSDLEDEEDDDDIGEDGKKLRRKKSKKKEPAGGPLTTLPVAAYDKRKKKRSRGSKGNIGEMLEEDDDTGSDEHSSEQRSAAQGASVPRGSAPPPLRTSVPRGSVPPPNQFDSSGPTDESMDVEQGLDSIEEVDEQMEPPQVDGYHRSTSSGPNASFSVGGFLGKLVNYGFRFCAGILWFFLWVLSTTFFLIGTVLGTTFDVIFSRPAQWLSRANPGPAVQMGKYILVALTMYAVWYLLRDPVLQWVPHRISSSPVYHVPDIPATDISQLSARLQSIENALHGLSLDHKRSILQQERDAKGQSDLVGRLGVLEKRVQKESVRASETEQHYKAATSQGLEAVRQEVEVLQAQLDARSHVPTPEGPRDGNDEEARARLKTLEERVGTVEGGVKEALELGKHSVKAGGASTGSAWWNKLASGSSSGLTIKTTDGQDVMSLLGELIDSRVSQNSKDDLARPDFAAYSGGSRLIPSLTTPTYEMRPMSLRGQLVGLVTGSGYAIGRPPVTALSHDLHNGHCWPFAGTQGQLAVALAAPTYISDVTIDHVAKDVAFDMRSAPREMEVWAMVEGKDNIKKVKEWQAEKARRREEARQQAEAEGVSFVEETEPEYPRTLPKSPQYLRIANFTYNIHDSRNIQTFPVSDEIRDLGVDFGIVVLRIKSNWGRDEYTCLYRLRVHGQRAGESPLPYPEDAAP